MLRRISFTALILAGAFTLARADVYRWIDEHGQAHYSDQWVPGSEVIRTGKAHPAGAEAAEAGFGLGAALGPINGTNTLPCLTPVSSLH